MSSFMAEDVVKMLVLDESGIGWVTFVLWFWWCLPRNAAVISTIFK